MHRNCMKRKKKLTNFEVWNWNRELDDISKMQKSNACVDAPEKKCDKQIGMTRNQKLHLKNESHLKKCSRVNESNGE